MRALCRVEVIRARESVQGRLAMCNLAALLEPRVPREPDPASCETSSRRNPGVRRLPLAVTPTASGVVASRR